MRRTPTTIAIAATVITLAGAAWAGAWWEAQGTGCLVWNEAPREPEAVTWSGGCKNGKADGQGTLAWSYLKDGERKEASYEGGMRAGQFHGRGIMTSANGDRYEGDFRDGQRNGRGIFTSANDYRYEGRWQDNKPHGWGVATFASGNRYEGSWQDGKRSGRGIFTWADGSRYDGAFRNGHPHGVGTCRDQSGNEFECRWRPAADTAPEGDI